MTSPRLTHPASAAAAVLSLQLAEGASPQGRLHGHTQLCGMVCEVGGQYLQQLLHHVVQMVLLTGNTLHAAPGSVTVEASGMSAEIQPEMGNSAQQPDSPVAGCMSQQLTWVAGCSWEVYCLNASSSGRVGMPAHQGVCTHLRKPPVFHAVHHVITTSTTQVLS